MTSLAAMEPIQRRRVAIGLLVAAVALAIAAFAVPVWLVNRYYSRSLDENQGLLERYKRIAAARPTATRDLELIRAHDPRKFFLRTGASALSAAEAQEALRTIVEASGGRLITMQAPNTRVDGRYRQLTVAVQLTASVVALRKILSALETRSPMLFIDSMTVRSQVPGNFRPGPGAEPEMYVALEITGYALEGAT